MARITSDKLPRPIQEELVSGTYENVESVAEAYQKIYPQNVESLDDLKRFLDELVVGSKEEIKPAVLEVCEDKKKRTQIHTIFRNCPFLPKIETSSNTLDTTEMHVIKVSKVAKTGKKKMARNPGGQIERKPWPGGKQHRYVKFVMEKVNMDSNQALSSLSRVLRLPVKLFSVAGTKDKRAVTCQFVTAYQVNPVRLVNLNNVFQGLLKLGNFEYCADALGLGDLQGNEFEIVLRGLKGQNNALESDICMAVEKTRLQGFINYFGLQRFGTGQTPTHHVGEYLLCGNWKAAIDSILSVGNHVNSPAKEALHAFFADNDIKKAAELIPRKFPIQKALLDYLLKHGNCEEHYPAALLDLPKTCRNLYVHAFHSYVWNNVVSERIKLHGIGRILPGDLALPRQRIKDGEKVYLGKRKLQGSYIGIPEPSIITEEDIKSERYDFEDLVMPLPGSSVIYPQNSTALLYDRYINKVAGESLHNVRPFQYSSFTGDYRHILVKPKDLQYKLHRYNDLDEELPCFDDIGDLHHGAFLALVLKFSLPPSTYATMLIREVTKMQTDVDFAKSLDHSLTGQEEVKI